MPLVRILVDGFSLLHRWPELAPRHARHSSAAREELVQVLRQYGDAIGTPITVVFDGAGARASVDAEAPSTPEMEIIYSRAGQTADDIIERVAARLVSYGEVLVVSDDLAERDTVSSFGARTSRCAHFIKDVEFVLSEFSKKVLRHNRAESKNFRGLK